MSLEALDNQTAPWLVLAVGNPSRGDDALGPTLIERLSHDNANASDVEFLVDFQLQVEHALDLNGRRAVLFVDAAHPGFVNTHQFIDAQTSSTEDVCSGAAITPICADKSVTPATHALSAEAVLHVAQLFQSAVPPAWQLAIEGQLFELGEGLSERAEQHLCQALTLAQHWLDERRREAVSVTSWKSHEQCMS